MWNASRFCVSSLRRGHANLLCIVPILVYVLPKQAHVVKIFHCICSYKSLNKEPVRVLMYHLGTIVIQSLVEYTEPIVLHKEHGHLVSHVWYCSPFCSLLWRRGACHDGNNMHGRSCLILFSILQSLVEHVEPIVLTGKDWTAMFDIVPIWQFLVEQVEPIVLTGKDWTTISDIVPHIAVSGWARGAHCSD